MEAQNKRKAEEDKKKQEQQAKKDAEAKVCLLSTMGEKKRVCKCDLMNT